MLLFSHACILTCLYSHMHTIVHQATDKVSRRPIMSNTCSTGLSIMLTKEVVEYLGEKAEFEKKSTPPSVAAITA